MPPFSGSATDRLHRAVGRWTLSGPTTAGFSVANFGVKRVHGSVPVTTAYVEVVEGGAIRGVGAVLDVAAIDTGRARRDADLRKPHLLDVALHPQITFTGQRVTPQHEGWVVTGLLTVKGTTQEITLEASALEQPDGTVRVHLTGQLDRRDHGIRAPRLLIGSLVDVEIAATLQRT